MADFSRNFRDRCPPPRTLCPRITGLEIYDVDRSNFFYSDWPSWFECDYSDHPLSKPTYSYFFWLSIWNQGSSAGDVQIYTLLREPQREHFAILTQSWFFGKLCCADHKIDRLMRHHETSGTEKRYFFGCLNPFLRVASVAASNCNTSYWHFLPFNSCFSYVLLNLRHSSLIYVTAPSFPSGFREGCLAPIQSGPLIGQLVRINIISHW